MPTTDTPERLLENAIARMLRGDPGVRLRSIAMRPDCRLDVAGLWGVMRIYRFGQMYGTARLSDIGDSMRIPFEAALQPSHRTRQIRSQHQHPEVVGAQHAVDHAVVDGQITDAAAHHGPQRVQFVAERHRVHGHRRVGDQPGLHVTATKPDGRHAPNEPVHRKPVHPFLHSVSRADRLTSQQRMPDFSTPR